MKNPDEYFMAFAELAGSRANCLKRTVGAVLIRDNHVIATGYNGTSKGVRNCTEGGCDRCFNAIKYPSGRDYDLCVCVHAEENTILQAARFGTAVDKAVVYTTLKPCLSCIKGIVNSGIEGIVYRDDWIIPIEQLDSYGHMAAKLKRFAQYEPPPEVEAETQHKIRTQA